jgi:hypothetical protein
MTIASRTTSRFLFPEDPTVFVYGRPNTPILTPPRTGFQIFMDKACTSLADIEDPQGGSIAYSTVYTDEIGRIPDFYGPAGLVRELYIRPLGTQHQGYRVDARFSDQITSVPTLLVGNGVPGADEGVIGSIYIDFNIPEDPNRVAEPRLFGPRTMDGWPTPGYPLRGPQGLPGDTFTWYQDIAQDVWTMDHPLPFHPSVTLIDSNNQAFDAPLEYPYLGRVIARLGAPETGRGEMT